MSFYPLVQPVHTAGNVFSFKDITPPYPDSPIGWGAPNAPADATAITAVWGEVQPAGGISVQSTAATGSLSDIVVLNVPVPEGVNIVHLYYGEFIPFNFNVSDDRLTLTSSDDLTNLLDAVSALSVTDIFPAKIESITEGVITLSTPLDSILTTGTHLFRHFDVQVNITPVVKTAKRVAVQRILPVAEQLALGAKTSGNGFNLKWTVLPAELTTAPKFVAIGSSTFAGSGASVYANSVAGKLAAQLNTISPGTAVLCNNAASLQDTRYALPNGADPLTKENRNISMAMAANPTAIIIAFPTNDIGNGLTPAQFRDNIQTMYSLARQRGIPTFVISPQPRTGYNVSQQNDLLTAAALIKDIIPVEFYADVMEPLRDTTSTTKLADLNPLYNADNIHPNDAGHTVIYNILWNLIVNYFTNPVYTAYTIESATVSGNGVIPYTWNSFDTITSGSTVNKNYSRIDGDWHAYRITATKPDNSTTTPSDPIWIYQPILSSAVEQTVQIDFGLTTTTTPPADWNNFATSSSGPTLNQTLTLTDNLGASSGITATVTKTFTAAGAGGANSGAYPKYVMQDNWYMSSTQVLRAQLQLSGLLPANLYNIEFLSSRDTTTIDRIMCLTVNDGTAVDKRDSMACAIAPDTPNQFGIRTLQGIVPTSAGDITIDIHCAGTLSYINGMVIRRMSNI
ncbi:Lysophospholipase L1 [Chitinophaga sp. CF118]|uniref:SGNH/GDSL hydrolase family protein n=1 Tax=Chitinophaga sp. CF118 TaxID=1884367 RepID=UPI0008E1378D|nr:SGNH/GDSL hydrolase family protein [Chitinophaga sp. CF118]SFD63763.1 Lysophospholipase L1 [Chitinophaga sp. CF118]